MKRVVAVMVAVCVSVGLVARAQDRAPLTKGFVKGAVELQSIGALSFGQRGLLAVADPKAGAVFCIETEDRVPRDQRAAPPKVENVDAVLAAKLGAPANGISINDMQANRASGAVYFSVTKKDDQKPVLMKIDREGKAHVVALDNVSYGKIALPTKEGVKLSTITDIEFSRSRVIVAAQATEQFASKVYTISLPFTHNGNADVFSTETFHVSHNAMETRAPIRTLTSYNDGKQDVVVGAFTCTPVVKYSTSDMGPDAKVRGTSVVELGSGNQPLDLFFYKKGDAEWLLVSNNRHGVLKVTAKVFSETEKVDAKALHRKRVADGTFPTMDGIEQIKSLDGTLEMSPLGADKVAVVRKTDSGLMLEVVDLP